MQLKPTVYKSKKRAQKGARVLTVIMSITIAAALCLTGIAVYYNFFAPKLPVGDTPTPSVPPTSTLAPPSPTNTSAPTSTSAPSPTLAPVEVKALRAVTIPKSALTDTDKLADFIITAMTSGANAFIINVKNEDGLLLYKSQLVSVKEMETQSENAVDISDAVRMINDSGCFAVAKMYCFRDKTAPRANLDMAVSIKKNYIWLDASGNCWLNPYSTSATDYLYSIAGELYSMGFAHILLDGAEFPDTGVLTQIEFPQEKEYSKSDAILSFINGMTLLAAKHGGSCSVMIDAAAAFGLGSVDKGHCFSWQYFERGACFSPTFVVGDYSGICTDAVLTSPAQFYETLDTLSIELKQRLDRYGLFAIPILDMTDTDIANSCIPSVIANGLSGYILLMDNYDFSSLVLSLG